MDELTGEPIFGLSVNLAVATQEGNNLEKYLDLTVRSLSQRSVTFNHNLTYQMSYSFWEKGKQTKNCVQVEFLNIFLKVQYTTVYIFKTILMVILTLFHSKLRFISSNGTTFNQPE